jgi:hypothetical protein
VDPVPFNTNSRLRASDADRDRAASVLNEALADGRLDVQEHADRLDVLYAAKTHGEIVPVLDDLPAPGSAPHPPVPREDGTVATGQASKIVAVFSGATRKGQWHVEPNVSVVAVFGGVELDFRDAKLSQREITINAMAVFGGISIVVPPEMCVTDSGSAVFGGREIDARGDTGSADPQAPVLRLTGACVFGGIDVKHKPRKPKKR